MKYTRLVYETISITKHCGTFNTYARNCNIHNEMKTTVTLSDAHAALCLSQLHKAHQACIYIYIMKSVTRKRCSLRYTYRRNCISATEMKLNATQEEGCPTINSNHKYANFTTANNATSQQI